MYIDYNAAEEYPHTGYFYKLGVDDSKPLDEQVEEEIILLETQFDMSEGSDLNMSSFKIFFPFNYEKDILVINEGDTFKGNAWGVNVKGRVLSIYPSQIGGCMALLTRI